MSVVKQAVIEDLIILYHAGEASEETVQFIENWIKNNPEKKSLLIEEESPLPKIDIENVEPEDEMRELRRIRRLMQWRSGSLVLSVIFLVLSVRFEFFLLEKVVSLFRENQILNFIGLGLFVVSAAIYFTSKFRLKKAGF